MILGEIFFFKFLQNLTETLFLAYKTLNPESQFIQSTPQKLVPMKLLSTQDNHTYHQNQQLQHHQNNIHSFQILSRNKQFSVQKIINQFQYQLIHQLVKQLLLSTQLQNHQQQNKELFTQHQLKLYPIKNIVNSMKNLKMLVW